MSPSPLPRDLSEHIPLIVTTNIRITTLLCRCNNKYLDIIWKLHCYNLSALLQQLCVEIILLQLLNVVTVFITTYSLNVVTMEYFIVTITITSFAHALLGMPLPTWDQKDGVQFGISIRMYIQQNQFSFCQKKSKIDAADQDILICWRLNTVFI